MTTLERFAEAVTLAVALPSPAVILERITEDEVDDGLRATSYDGDRIAGGSGKSHPERMLEARNPEQFPPDDPNKPPRTRRSSTAPRDRARLEQAQENAIDAIAALNAECCDAGMPETWEEATTDANVIHETGMLKAAIDVGRDVERWAMRYVHAIDTVRAVHDAWMPHEPPQGLAEENIAWCRPCLRIDEKRKRITKVCCQRCWRDILDLEGFITDDDGEPIPAVELQLQPRYWPSEAMGRAREQARPILVDRERQAWLRSHGINPATAHQRRQERRSA